MANVLVDENSLSEIATAIREKNGSQDSYKPAQMAQAIARIQTGINAKTDTWDQVPGPVESFIQNVSYDPSDYSYSLIQNYAPTSPNYANTFPIGKTLVLPAGYLDRDGYKKQITAGDVEMLNSEPGKVTPYSVINSSGSVIAAGALFPTGFLRWIRCSTAKNVRDLGGWPCDGGTVKYGMLIRGGEPGADDKDVLVNQIGIRHELQLRGQNEAPQDYSLLGVGYTCAFGYVWYTIDSSSYEDWKTNLDCIFNLVRYGIPVYFHCSAGADRTATLACVLEALLGISQSDIDKEYELSNFYTGTDTDAHARRRNETGNWGKLITEIMAVALPAGVSSSIRNKALQFVINLGFSADTINAYRSAMINGNAAIAVHKINKSGDHVQYSNSETAIINGAVYSTTIAGETIYEIETVTVLMGGVDITSTTYDATNGIITIATVTGDISISATTVAHGYTNVWSLHAVNKRMDTNETDPTDNGSFITDFIPVTQAQLSGSNLVLRSNMDIFNFAERTSQSGDPVRYYPSATPGSQVKQTLLGAHRDFTSHDAESGIYTCTIPAAQFSSYISQIKYIRLCAKASTSAITESFFDGCILTINEPITP